MMGKTNTRQQRLVNECQGLVRFLAQQIHARMPARMDLEDLIGYGQVGLLQAAQDFDPEKGVKFSTFAYYRIRGSIYDGAHKLTWFKTACDRDVKYDRLADEVLESEEGAPAGGDDITREAGWFYKTASSLATVYLAAHDEGGTPDVVDRATPAPLTNLLRNEASSKLREALEHIPTDAAALIRAVYYEDQTLQEAAERLGISKSWASRMHARALQQLCRVLKSIGPGTV